MTPTGVKMDTLPLDLQQLWNESSDAVDPVMAFNTVMGHVHLHVPDLEQARSFYIDQLGFDLMCTFPGALFVAAGGYHHHLGLNTWAGNGLPPEGTAKLLQFDIHLGSVDAIQRLAMSLFFEIEEPWATELIVSDLFDNRICFLA